MGPHFVLTGLPGCGKTTIVQRVVEQLSKRYDLRTVATGFMTEEVLGPRGRVGFDVVSLDGSRASLSRKDAIPSHPPRPRVGRYAVDVSAFESVALPALAAKPGVQLVIVDEIGKMEFYSEPFLNAVRGLFDSDRIVFGVVPYFRENQAYPREHPLQSEGRACVREIVDRSDVKLLMVTKHNREGLVRVVTKDLLQALDEKLNP